MNLCKCGVEIRDDQKICYHCMKLQNNWREIAFNEIIWDIDNGELGAEGIKAVANNLTEADYRFEVYYAEGQRSPHLHIKNIPGLEKCSNEQLKVYKNEILKKYCPVKYLPFLDFNLKLISEENKPHFKYKTVMNLLYTSNDKNQNFCEIDILEKTLDKIKDESKPIVKNHEGFGRRFPKLSIIQLAKEFGLEVHGNKTQCPFHPDAKTPSLVFYENQERFHCFGCGEDGNIIRFCVIMKKIRKEQVK